MGGFSELAKEVASWSTWLRGVGGSLEREPGGPGGESFVINFTKQNTFNINIRSAIY